MKANTPEKLYLHPTAKGKVGASWLTFPLTNEDVEYIRKDAFIEKTAKWLIDNIQNYTDDGMGEHSFVLVQDLNDDFKKYIEEKL